MHRKTKRRVANRGRNERIEPAESNNSPKTSTDAVWCEASQGAGVDEAEIRQETRDLRARSA